MATEWGARLRLALSERLTPEHTRRATWFERHTVVRLPWHHLIRLHRYLEFLGRLTLAIWVAFMGSLVMGIDWRDVLEEAVNSGRPVKGAVVLVIVLPTLAFVAARSLIGFLRWRVQRELWRRDVERVGTR